METEQLSLHEKEQLINGFVTLNKTQSFMEEEEKWYWATKDGNEVSDDFDTVIECIESAYEQFVTQDTIDKYLFLKNKSNIND